MTASIAGVTDADNVGPTNPTGAISGQVAYTWQVERDPGTGVFEDIINLPAGDLAFQSANGRRFRVTPDLAGLSLRVKAIYQDAHGVPEIVFSDATAPVIDVPDAPPTAPPPCRPDVTGGGAGLNLVRSDLDFILDQIKIAEAHAHGEDALAAAECPRGRRPAHGRRRVQQPAQFGGVDQTEFGAADNVFPRLTDPVFDPRRLRLRIRAAGRRDHLRADQRHRVRLAAAHHQQPDRRPDRQQSGRLRDCLRAGRRWTVQLR